MLCMETQRSYVSLVFATMFSFTFKLCEIWNKRIYSDLSENISVNRDFPVPNPNQVVYLAKRDHYKNLIHQSF